MSARVLAALPLGALGLFASTAFAQGASVSAPGAAGQEALAVLVDADGAVRARVCAAGKPCDAAGAPDVTKPQDRGHAKGAVARVIPLEGGRALVRVAPKSGAGFNMLLAAPPAGQGDAPIVFWSGEVDVPKGEPGEARANVVLEQPGPRGVRVVLGQHRDDVSVCGRAALTNAQVLDPATLRFEKGVAVVEGGLSEAERAKATKLTAARVDGASPARPLRLLVMRSASSSIEGAVGALSDGDLDTTWSEAKTGDGRGEFVTFTSASEVPVAGLEIAVRPARESPKGAAPRELFVATDDKVFAVTLPEDAWSRPPHTRYAVSFPEPVRSNCVALVLGAAYPRGGKDADITLAEVTARTPYDEMDLPALVGALAGGGERARGAGAMLEHGGLAAARAVIAAYDKLDDAAKELGRRVVDQAPCAEQTPFYAARFAFGAAHGRRDGAAPGDISPDFIHARDRLRMCKQDGAVALVKLVGDPDDKTRAAAAEELPVISPAAAVPALLDAITALDAAPAPKGGVKRGGARADLVGALATAARSDRARIAVALELEPARFASRPPAVRAALLRAVGPGLPKAEGGAAAFASLAQPGSPFELRYLLQAPAAELARGGDARAADFLRTSLADADAHVRRRAAEVAARVPALSADLARAADDTDVRVREGAIEAIAAGHTAAAAADPLARRLADDDWPFVRAAAARALADAPANPGVDAHLAKALADASPDVRGAAADSLGARHAASAAPALRDLASNAGQSPDVRAHAISALGSLCDHESVSTLSAIALRARDQTDEIARRLAPATLAALAALGPPDLAARLAPLLAKDTPGPVRELARATLKSPPSCR
jgi:HEAT repeat protein